MADELDEIDLPGAAPARPPAPKSDELDEIDLPGMPGAKRSDSDMVMSFHAPDSQARSLAPAAPPPRYLAPSRELDRMYNAPLPRRDPVVEGLKNMAYNNAMALPHAIQGAIEETGKGNYGAALGHAGGAALGLGALTFPPLRPIAGVMGAAGPVASLARAAGGDEVDPVKMTEDVGNAGLGVLGAIGSVPGAVQSIRGALPSGPTVARGINALRSPVKTFTNWLEGEPTPEMNRPDLAQPQPVPPWNRDFNAVPTKPGQPLPEYIPGNVRAQTPPPTLPLDEGPPLTLAQLRQAVTPMPEVAAPMRSSMLSVGTNPRWSQPNNALQLPPLPMRPVEGMSAQPRLSFPTSISSAEPVPPPVAPPEFTRMPGQPLPRPEPIPAEPSMFQPPQMQPRAIGLGQPMPQPPEPASMTFGDIGRPNIQLGARMPTAPEPSTLTFGDIGRPNIGLGQRMPQPAEPASLTFPDIGSPRIGLGDRMPKTQEPAMFSQMVEPPSAQPEPATVTNQEPNPNVTDPQELGPRSGAAEMPVLPSLSDKALRLMQAPGAQTGQQFTRMLEELGPELALRKLIEGGKGLHEIDISRGASRAEAPLDMNTQDPTLWRDMNSIGARVANAARLAKRKGAR